MALDRGTLAKIDRRIFAEFDHTDGAHMVKVPLSDRVWSTWRRYCDALGLTMGEGIAGLIAHELRTVVAQGSDGDAVFAERAERQARAQKESLDGRERDLDAYQQRLATREGQLHAWDQRIREEASRRGQSLGWPKVGRNERCPCGSGLKHKHCHGLPRPRN